MSRSTTRKGPLVHRLLIGVFGVLLTRLLVWLFGFVLKDIGRLPGPDYVEVEGRYVDKALAERKTELEKEVRNLETQIATLRQTQEILRNSTEGSRQTMNQLLDIQRLGLEKNVTPTQEEQDALAKSEQKFLRKQEEFRQANEEIAQLSRHQSEIQEKVKALQEQITAQQKPARDEYARLRHRHSLLIAALKLGFLLPVLFAAAGSA